MCTCSVISARCRWLEALGLQSVLSFALVFASASGGGKVDGLERGGKEKGWVGGC